MELFQNCAGTKIMVTKLLYGKDRVSLLCDHCTRIDYGFIYLHRVVMKLGIVSLMMKRVSQLLK